MHIGVVEKGKNKNKKSNNNTGKQRQKICYTYFFLRREPKSLRSDYNKGPAAVIMSGRRSLFSTLYTDSFLASRQTESFSSLLLSLSLSLSLSFCTPSDLLTLKHKHKHSFPFYFFHVTSLPPVNSSQQLKLLPQPTPPLALRPPPDVAPGANNFSYIIRTWHTQCALLLPLYETVFNHVISFIFYFIFISPSSRFIFQASRYRKTNISYL